MSGILFVIHKIQVSTDNPQICGEIPFIYFYFNFYIGSSSSEIVPVEGRRALSTLCKSKKGFLFFIIISFQNLEFRCVELLPDFIDINIIIFKCTHVWSPKSVLSTLADLKQQTKSNEIITFILIL